jgi:hypothetical protein
MVTHGVSDPSVVDPDAWVNAHSAVASTRERVVALIRPFLERHLDRDTATRQTTRRETAA